MRGLLRSARAGLKVRRLQNRHWAEAVAYLETGLPQDLLLLDLLDGSDVHTASGMTPHAFGAWRDDALVGLALGHPSVVLDSRLAGDVLDALCGPLETVEAGLLKSAPAQVGPVWQRLWDRGRRAHLDRMETGFLVRPRAHASPDLPPQSHFRKALAGDLDVLVESARASLLEEGRPDPDLTDPVGFRRWVASRMPRARIIEYRGAPVFVGYADVHRPEGWLIQGVFTVPALRRRGFAAAGVAALLAEAFAAGADHVQLTAIDDNRGARRLYENLGFEPFGPIRTILFS